MLIHEVHKSIHGHAHCHVFFLGDGGPNFILKDLQFVYE